MSWIRFGRAAVVTAFTLAALAGLVAAGQPGNSAPGTKFGSGRAAQFATTTQCGGAFGPGSTYCDTPLSPAP